MSFKVEYIYPPLTFLSVVGGSYKEGNVTIVEVMPQMSWLVDEALLSKRKHICFVNPDGNPWLNIVEDAPVDKWRLLYLWKGAGAPHDREIRLE